MSRHDSGINDQLINITLLIHGLNVFRTHTSVILFAAILA